MPTSQISPVPVTIFNIFIRRERKAKKDAVCSYCFRRPSPFFSLFGLGFFSLFPQNCRINYCCGCAVVHLEREAKMAYSSLIRSAPSALLFGNSCSEFSVRRPSDVSKVFSTSFWLLHFDLSISLCLSVFRFLYVNFVVMLIAACVCKFQVSFGGFNRNVSLLKSETGVVGTAIHGGHSSFQFSVCYLS